MNKWRQFKIVFRKEWKDAFRDKKSVFATFGIPIILFPAILLVLSLGIGTMTNKMAKPNVAFVEYNSETGTERTVTREGKDAELFSYLENTVLASLKDESGKHEYKISDTKDAKQAMVEGKISLIMKVEAGFMEVMQDSSSEEQRDIRLVYDERSTMGSFIASNFRTSIGTFLEDVVQARLNHKDNPDIGYLQPSGITSLKFNDEYAGVARSGVGNVLMQMLLPFLFTYMLACGGTSIAVDLVAGEKERNTFEALLTTSADRFSILSAKFVLILLFSFLSALLQSVSSIIAMLINPMTFLGTDSFNVEPGALVLMFLNILMLSALFSSLLLLISSGAKTYKEANSKASLMTFLPILSVVVMIMDAADLNLGFMFLPIVNVAAVIKMVLVGQINYVNIGVALVVNVVLAALAVFFTLRSFKKENLITRG